MRRVVVLEDDDDLRSLLCELMQLAGIEECISAPSLEELEGVEKDVLDCELAILDVNLGADVASGVDALRWLRGHGFRGKAVFLTGHAATHPLVKAAFSERNAEVLSKPVHSHVLQGLLEPADGLTH